MNLNKILSISVCFCLIFTKLNIINALSDEYEEYDDDERPTDSTENNPEIEGNSSDDSDEDYDDGPKECSIDSIFDKAPLFIPDDYEEGKKLVPKKKVDHFIETFAIFE